MARRTTHDVQVDPFNAGEPTLPWDEAGTFDLIDSDEGTGEKCAFGNEPYDGPTKARDNYDAPDSDAPRTLGPYELGGDDSLTPRQRRQAARARARDERRAAQAAPKDAPAARKRRLSVIRTIVIVFIVINIVPTLLVLALNIFDDIASSFGHSDVPNLENGLATGTPQGDADGDDTPSYVLDQQMQEAEQQKCIALVDEYLRDAITGDQPRELLVDTLNEDCSNALLGTCDELGIDAQAWADWEMEHLSYEIDSCYVQAEDDTATVYVNYTSAGGIFELQDIYDEIDRYLRSVDAWDEDLNMRALSDAERRKVGEIFTSGLEDIDAEQEMFFGTDLVRENGEWAIDMDSMSETTTMVLGVW